MRKILSIDVGIKNLACCMVDASSNKITYWDNINLCGDKEIPCNYCKAPAKYSKSNDFYCKKHAKQYSTYLIPEINIQNLNKIKKRQLLETYKKFLAVSNQQKDDNTIKKCKKTDLEDGIKNIYDAHYLNHIYKTKAHDFDLITLGRNINSIFNNLFKEMNISADNLKKVIIENQISPIANRMKSIQGMLTQYFITKDIVENIININKVIGSPVGVIIAENINTNKKISFLLLVNKDLLIIFFLIRK